MKFMNDWRLPIGFICTHEEICTKVSITVVVNKKLIPQRLFFSILLSWSFSEAWQFPYYLMHLFWTLYIWLWLMTGQLVSKSHIKVWPCVRYFLISKYCNFLSVGNCQLFIIYSAAWKGCLICTRTVLVNKDEVGEIKNTLHGIKSNQTQQ